MREYIMQIEVGNSPITVQELVRCKDCKYHEDEVPGMVWCPHIIGNWVNDNWFCAEGERSEDEL